VQGFRRPLAPSFVSRMAGAPEIVQRHLVGAAESVRQPADEFGCAHSSWVLCCRPGFCVVVAPGALSSTQLTCWLTSWPFLTT